jgi:hypothetical protein
MQSNFPELTRYSGASEQYLETDRAWSWFSLRATETRASVCRLLEIEKQSAIAANSQVGRLPSVRLVDHLLVLIDISFELAQLPLPRPEPVDLAKVHANVVELEDHVHHLGLGRNHLQHLGNVRRVGPFPDSHGVVFGKRLLVHLFEELHQPGTVRPERV